MAKPWHKIFAILPDMRLALCMTAKCASTSIINTLLEHYEAEAERPFHGNACFAWMTLNQVERCVPTYRRAMFVRNPFDRLVACYEFHVRRKSLQASKNLRDLGFRADMTFDDFMDLVLADTEADPHYCVQALQTGSVDFVGRFETLDKDWPAFVEWTGHDLPALHIANRGPDHREHYRSYFGKELRRRTERAYSLDLETFGYSF